MPATADPLAEPVRERPAWQVLSIAAGIVVLALLSIAAVVSAAALTAPYSPLAGRVHRAGVGLVVVLVIYESARRVSGVPAGWFLADRPSRGLAGWFLLGLALPTVILGLQLWLLGAERLGELPALGTVLRAAGASFAAGLLAGVLEELSFRGALLRVLEARWGSQRAIAVTAVAFALLHQGHADGPIELLLVISSMVAAGLLLAVVVVRTRSVWNAVALHAGWNTVFGGTLVAAAPTTRLLDPAVVQYQLPTAPIWLTGGGATLGAAPLTTACLLTAAIIVAIGGDPRLPSGRKRGSGRPGSKQ